MSDHVPRANSIMPFLCKDPECKAVHLVLLDADEVPIAQATINAEMVNNWQKLLYRAAVGEK